ncbi:E3 ubiquitin-protein ligase RNF183 [Dunckerocampus dactyliophorus]|uniref:E3 ubiquitin-protein ligase RNF183 n=1 Tax=Dunckerocampus dactyliophorus TaxID=161453 RepID=UPI00240562E5|nr:E3 ubiquitin-protein ligase RNF183 [Dunckerocampus dactyliophorus]XP_054638563.1 E3 ubiquitin-protein ligase RNF183 [Dunckerocampus dactyliophorus]
MSDDRERRRSRRSRSHDTGPAPNVKPRMNSKENRRPQPAKVRRSRSIDSERGVRGRRTERHQEDRTRRGRSAEADRRARRDGDTDRYKKVRPPEDDVEETECAICFCSYDNIFKTPKLLACGHTFCLECLARINVTSPEVKTLTCPVCREVTDIPHGQDLPRLGNNENIIGRLPPEMQRTKSIRFKRSKGKLFLKNAPAGGLTQHGILTLPHKSQEAQAAPAGDLRLTTIEQGMEPTTVVDVGRPPNRVRGRMRRFFRSNRCYYATVATVVTIAVALLLVGILLFIIIPSAARRPERPGNQTEQSGRVFAPGV